MVEKGGDLKSLASLLGHSDEQTSLIYLHTHDKKKKATIALLENNNEAEKFTGNKNTENENVTVVIDKEAMELFLKHASNQNIDCTNPSEFVKNNLSLLKVV